MADIDVEELLRQGGRPDDGDVSVDDLVAQGGKEDAPSVLRTAVRSAIEGINPLWDAGAILGGTEGTPSATRTYERSLRQGVNPLADEGAGFVGATVDAGRRLVERGDVTSPSEWLDGYRRNRDEARVVDAAGARAHPTAATLGHVTGAIVQGVATGGAGGVGRGLVSAVTSGATQGAVNALAGSEADLTRLEGENYARAFTDTLEGGAAGAVGGGVGYGAGKGLAYVGGKAVNAYRGARGALEAEVRAGMEAEEAALRAKDAKEAGPIERAQGQAMEGNKAFDAKAAREKARRVAQEARAAARAQRSGQSPAPRATPPQSPSASPPSQYPGHRRFVGAPNVDPDTKVLKGYEGGAHRRRVDNAPKVLAHRERLARSDITPAERAEAEAYVGRHGDAVDNPPAFRLRIIEDELVRRGYSPDVVRRAMARFDAQGRAVSRGAMPAGQPALPERTAVAEGSDWMKRGHDMEELAQQGGGGPSAFGQHFADAKTRVDPRMQPSLPMDDAFHDAPTRAALIRTKEPEVLDGYSSAPMHEFNFRDPKSKRDYLVIARESPHDSEGLILEIVRPLEVDTQKAISSEGWAAERGKVGPGTIKQLSQELAREFPGRKVLHAERATGANPRDHMSMRLPEVTNPGNSPAYEVTRTKPMDLRDAVIQGRGEELLQQGGGGASAFGDAFAEAPTRAGTPDLPEAVQRFDVLGGRPAVRTGQPYARYGAPRGRALPPEDVAAAEEAMAARRAQAFGSNPSGPAPEPTAGARPRAMPPEASASMRAPEDGPTPTDVTDTGMDPRFEPTFAEGTRATRVPEVRRGAMGPEPTTVQPAPGATQVRGPSDFTDRTRYAAPAMAQRLAGRPSVDSLVDERIAGGGAALRGAFMRGATGESGAMAGVAGLALGGPAGGLKALALRGGLEVVREALRNPAAKARAIEAFKIQRLATIRPEVWGRVSATLQRAQQRDEEAGTNYHLRAARHALLQTDPAFRAAEAEAAKELQGLSEDELARRLVQ